MSLPPRVALESCSKRFGERLALRRATLVVEPGERVALLGANGSGKSTLLRLVAGLARPTAGTATLDGVASVEAPPALRRRIGYVAHRALAYRGLTAAENLALFARLYRVDAAVVPGALDRVGLGPHAAQPIDRFSRGMTQRLSIARALLHDPDLLLLDEAATGLDAEGRALLDALLEERRGRATLLFSSHDADAARRAADRVVTLVDGALR